MKKSNPDSTNALPQVAPPSAARQWETERFSGSGGTKHADLGMHTPAFGPLPFERASRLETDRRGKGRHIRGMR